MSGRAARPQAATVATKVVGIKVMQMPAAKTVFGPVGPHIAPDTTVRSVQVGGYHSVTAYQPKTATMNCAFRRK